jgi:hypothetical protein
MLEDLRRLQLKASACCVVCRRVDDSIEVVLLQDTQSRHEVTLASHETEARRTHSHVRCF